MAVWHLCMDLASRAFEVVNADHAAGAALRDNHVLSRQIFQGDLSAIAVDLV
jgi:hypothetical protein